MDANTKAYVTKLLRNSQSPDEFEALGMLTEIKALDIFTTELILQATTGSSERLVVNLPEVKCEGFLYKHVTVSGKKIPQIPVIQNADIKINYWYYGNEVLNRCSSEPIDDFIDGIPATDVFHLIQTRKEDYVDFRPETVTQDEFPTSLSFEEMLLIYTQLTDQFPAEIRADIERLFVQYKNQKDNSEKKITLRQLRSIIPFPQTVKKESISAPLLMVENILSKLPGYQAFKNKLLGDYIVFSKSPNHIAPQPVFISAGGCERYILKTFAKAINLAYTEIDVSEIHDQCSASGSSTTYDNGAVGTLFKKAFCQGPQMLVIRNYQAATNNLSKDNSNLQGIIDSIIKKEYINEFLEMQIPYDSTWIVVEGEPDSLSGNLRNYCYTCPKEDLTEEEKIQYLHIFLEEATERLGRIQEISISDAAVRMLLRCTRRKCFFEDLQTHAETIAWNAFSHHEKITVHNLVKYLPLLNRKAFYKKTPAENVTEAAEKLMLLYDELPFAARAEALLAQVDIAPASSSNRSLIIKKLLALVNYTGEQPYSGKIRPVLDQSIYGMENVKNRLEDVLSKEISRPYVILLEGQPGTGKTSIAKAVAQARNLHFIERNATELLPDDITGTNLKPGLLSDVVSGSGNPVILLDEIDKAPFLFNVLHSLFNGSFYDEYFGTTYTTDGWIFILTSNDKGLLPRSLVNRMETIHVESYNQAEQLVIARQYLLPRIKKELNSSNISLPEDVLKLIIHDYVDEGGIRSLERILRIMMLRLTRLKMEKQYIASEADVKSIFGPVQNIQIEPEIGTAFTIRENSPVKIQARYDCAHRQLCSDFQLENAKRNVREALSLPEYSDFVLMIDGSFKSSMSMAAAVAMLSGYYHMPAEPAVYLGCMDLYGNFTALPPNEEIKGLLSIAERYCSTVYLPAENLEYAKSLNTNIQLVPVSGINDLIRKEAN